MKALLLAALLPLAAEAQLALVSVAADGTETPVAPGSYYDFGPVTIGTTSTALLRIYNRGIAPVTVTSVATSGAGFTSSASPLPPHAIPGNSTQAQAMIVAVYFAPTQTLSCVVSCNASLTISSTAGTISTFLIGSGVPTLTVTSGAGCSSSTPFNWGNVTVGKSSTCTFTLANLNTQAVTVSSIVINGLGFTGPYGITSPLSIPPGQSASFSVNFTPPGALIYTGSLVVGTQSFPVTGTGQQPPLPTPTLQFDAASYASAQQGVLSVTIPGGAPVAATGYVNLTFTPSTPVVKDDSAIAFLANGARTIPFSVNAGDTTVLLNGQNSAVFQTGTTEGTLTFSLTTAAAIVGTAPVKQFSIGGAKVIIESTAASKQRTGFLDITVVGADNTYSAGAMSFAFSDTSGNAIGSAANADFTPIFKTYYGGQTAGSAFRALVSFPITGSTASIGSVTVTLTNAAGVATTGSLTFQ
jgi:hypothetical protein